MKVVVADDDLSQRFYIAAVLRRLGHVALQANDGLSAIDALRSSDATMLICDIEMPGMDGMQLVRLIRQEAFNRYIYVLMITGRDRPKDRVAGLEAGADDFMNKPVDPSILELRIRAAQRLFAYEQELQAKNHRIELAYLQIQDDLDAAARAQRQLLPAAAVKISSCCFSSSFLPSRSVSGDIFGYFPLGTGEVGLYAADVAGHGVRAALSAVALGHMISPDYFRELVTNEVNANAPRPEWLAYALDHRFGSYQTDDSYFTLFAAAIVESSDTLHYCQAGYPGPLLMRKDGDLEWIGDGGMPVAMLPDADFEGKCVAFLPGDRLVIHSDGITEAMNPAGQAFGDHRFADFMAQRRSNPPSIVFEELAVRLQDWTGDASLQDDVTLILIDREAYQ